MTETSLEELVQERQFVGLLQTQSQVFFRLANTLLSVADDGWSKKHFFQLINEADTLESFLDDYGARLNRTFAFLTELVASIRGFAMAGYSVAHLRNRFDSYGTGQGLPPAETAAAHEAITVSASFLRQMIAKMLRVTREEAQALGVEITPETYPESNFQPVVARRRLPRNVGQSVLVHEDQRIAEVVTKYLQACEMLAQVGVRRIEDAGERDRFLLRSCSEEQARVYEATVHNLQSTYDTYVRNTTLESQDARLPRIRGHVSAALHLLEAVTHLVHFVERHEDGIQGQEEKLRIRDVVDRSAVQEIVLNHLLAWADRILQAGARVAEELLPAYTNVQELEIRLADDLRLHARPVSLIVGIVTHFGTPVEMEVGGKRADAGSILELLVAVGSRSEERLLLFRGDERPLGHIRLLFEAGLGEQGLDGLPEELGYLRGER